MLGIILLKKSARLERAWHPLHAMGSCMIVKSFKWMIPMGKSLIILYPILRNLLSLAGKSRLRGRVTTLRDGRSDHGLSRNEKINPKTRIGAKTRVYTPTQCYHCRLKRPSKRLARAAYSLAVPHARENKSFDADRPATRP